MPKKNAKAAQNEPLEMMLVGTKVKAALRSFEVNVGEGTLEALNGMLFWYIQQAALRAKANKRKTVRGYDIMVGEE